MLAPLGQVNQEGPCCVFCPWSQWAEGESWDEKLGDGAKGQTPGSSQALHEELDRLVAGRAGKPRNDRVVHAGLSERSFWQGVSFL